MNKNLKKVISTVADSLAVTASSLVAFAANFPDGGLSPQLHIHRQLLELTALGVINGYEDGTFRPDKNVTRAEITKDDCFSIRQSSQLSAANAAKGGTQSSLTFRVHTGQSGFCNSRYNRGNKSLSDGYSDKQSLVLRDNVTYAQAIKMLVAALGYKQHMLRTTADGRTATFHTATTLISQRVSRVLQNDTQVTRARVAQMCDRQRC